MKKWTFSILIIGILISAPLTFAEVTYVEENQDLMGTVLWSPFKWSESTVSYVGDVIGIPFGVNGNLQDNWNYSGEGNAFGFYESFSDDSAYRFQRYGVN